MKDKNEKMSEQETEEKSEIESKPEELDSGLETEIKEEIEVDVNALLEENKKLREDYLRAFADAENTKRRAQQEIEKNNKYAVSSFAKNLLSVADNLQRAIDSAQENTSESSENLIKGIELTREELFKVFSKFNISKMEIMNTVFDPNFHQVIQEVEDKTKPAGTIIAELQSGYMISDRILREAMVIVTK